jgi:hypothetical protein
MDEEASRNVRREASECSHYTLHRIYMDETSSAAPGRFAEKVHAFVRECDLVMKGGITSGVVYPLAIVEIGKAFRLRSIGGTSAGAIAAAAAGAAEVGRQRRQAGLLGKDHQDFAALAKLPEHLGKPATGAGSKLEAFFQPSAPLRRVFMLGKGQLGKSGASLVCGLWIDLLRHFWLAGLLGALIGSIALWSTPWQASYVSALSMAVVLGLICATACALGHAIWTVVSALPANGFGMCTGMPNGKQSDEEALTVWLAKFYDKISGESVLSASHPMPLDRAKPLTFGDLERHGVDLQVMTTCLTMGRPFRLPFRHDEIVKENRQFYFRRDEFEQLFPSDLVRWMCAHQRAQTEEEKSSSFRQADLEDFCRLPEPGDLPVVVAVRMSLSFPILLSAVPLYAFDFRLGAPQGRPQRCWFTDGGISSNFPIHFFDSPVPARPTFGLDLGTVLDESQPRVYMPASNGGGILVARRLIAGTGLGSIADFLGALLSVAKDWNHEALSHLPGYRDRIALIRLTGEEGGLNLNMPAKRIELLAGFGQMAGQEFVRRFGDPALGVPRSPEGKMNWDNHQRIRLRLLIASVAETLDHMLSAHERMQADDMPYERFFDTGVEGDGAYAWAGRSKADQADAAGLPVSQAGLGKLIYERLLEIARQARQAMAAHPEEGGESSRIDPLKDAPRPVPEAKLRPRI